MSNKPKPCKHDWQYYILPKEKGTCGWTCINCQLHYDKDSPEAKTLDDQLLSMKVFGIASDLFDQGFIYISNGSTGEAVNYNVCGRCRSMKRSDQLFIIAQIVQDSNIDLYDQCKHLTVMP